MSEASEEEAQLPEQQMSTDFELPKSEFHRRANAGKAIIVMLSHLEMTPVSIFPAPWSVKDTLVKMAPDGLWQIEAAWEIPEGMWEFVSPLLERERIGLRRFGEPRTDLPLYDERVSGMFGAFLQGIQPQYEKLAAEAAQIREAAGERQTQGQEQATGQQAANEFQGGPSELPRLRCPNCNQRLNAPAGKRLRLTCPICKHAWEQTT